MKKQHVQLEFKSSDDAWYDVSLETTGSSGLKVYYFEFPEESADTLALEDFNSVEDLRSRFRFSSKQLQDENCGKVKEGIHICASCSSDGNDRKFFDAVVQQICRSKHRSVNGEEECRCTFKVLWKSGPYASKSTPISCEDICLLTPGKIESHPIIKAFVKLIEEKVDCNLQSLGRNPQKKRAANMKGSNTTNHKDKQGELGRTSSNLVSASDPKGKIIISGQGRIENYSDTIKQNVAIERTKNSIEAVLPSVNESCKMEKETNDGLIAIENVVSGSEVLLRDPDSSSNELELPDISRYHMGSHINISSSSHGKNGVKMLKTTNEAPLVTTMKSSDEASPGKTIKSSYEAPPGKTIKSSDQAPPGKTIKTSDEAPLGTSIKSSDEAPHGDTFLIKWEKTHFDSVRKEKKLSLDLNSVPVEFKQEQLDMSTPTVSFYSNANIDANNTNRKDNQFLGLDSNFGIPENRRPFSSGWLEAEDCDILQIKKSGVNAVNNDIASNSACWTADIRNKGNKLFDDNSLYACRGIKRSSLPLIMDNWDEGYNCERVSEQLSGEMNKKDGKITEDKDGEKKFLASCGKGKRQKHISNEMFAREKKVQDYNQTGENVKASKKLIQDGNDFSGVDTPSSSCLTSHLKCSTSHNKMEPLDFSIGMEGLVDHNLVKEETEEFVHDHQQSFEQITSNQVPPREIPIVEVEMSSYNKSCVAHFQGNVSYDINARRSSRLRASPMKVSIRNDPSDSYKDSSDHPDLTVNKVDAVKGVSKHAKLHWKDKSLPGFLSDEENDHGTSKKTHDNEILDLSRQLGNHVQLPEGLSTNKKIKEDCTCKSGCHKNGKTRNQCNPIYRCKSEGQKNAETIQHHNNGHSVSEKSNCCSSDYSDATDMPFFHNEQDCEMCRSHLTSKKCEKVSPTSCKVHSRPGELHARQTSLTTSNQHRTFSGNSITVHCGHSSQSSGCRCCELHSCDSSASSEDESFDEDVTGCVKVSNCKYCGKSMKPMVSSKRASMRILRGPREARCGYNGAGSGYCCEDMGTEERLIHYSEVLLIDNLEKDVRPSAVKEVISSVICGVVQVYILPSPKFEQFTRGFVWFQDRASLMKALVWLQADSFFIMSSNGRPWVVLHIDNGVCEGIFGGYTIESKDSKQYCSKTSSSSTILFVHKGTDEYERAKIRKNAFLEFRDHLAILHKRLELEEKQLDMSPGTD